MVNMHAAKTHLSRLVDQAMAGEDVVIGKNGTPLVRLVPVRTERRRTGFGSLKGQMRVSADFDAPLPDDVLKAFGIRS